MPVNNIPQDIIADKLGLMDALMSGADAITDDITPDDEQEVEDFKKSHRGTAKKNTAAGVYAEGGV